MDPLMPKRSTVFILIPAHAPTRANLSYLAVINHQIINHLPMSFHRDYIPEINMTGNWPKMDHYMCWSILATNSETN